MPPINIGIVGLGTVGCGALRILADNATQIEAKLGFPLAVKALCSRSVLDKPSAQTRLFPQATLTTSWQDVVENPDIHIVAELIGGTTTASEIIEMSITQGKSVVTANKELMAARGAELCAQGVQANICLAMEASVAGGIPIHSVLREGISGDRVKSIVGILNGTCNYVLTEMERSGSSMDSILTEAQRLGYAEADPSADVDGYDAQSKLALLAALAFGVRVAPADIYREGIRRMRPIDFSYAHLLKHTIRLIASAEQSDGGLLLSVRPTLIPRSTILASVDGCYNAIWVRGIHGDDTFYYGQGAGSTPTGVAVVSDLMRVAREVVNGSTQRVSPFAHSRLEQHTPIQIDNQTRPHYLRFRVKDQPGIIATLAAILAEAGISLDAVLQEPSHEKDNLPFVITVEPTKQSAIARAVEQMENLDFLVEKPLVMPLHKGLKAT